MPLNDKEELILLLEEKARRLDKNHYLKVWESLYGWQKRFIAATKEYIACLLMAANRVGKTYTGCLVDSIHATGKYPDDWEGHRFESPPLIWVLGYSGEKIRDLLQRPIVGNYSVGSLEGGLIPVELIADSLPMMGTPRCVREVRVRHVSGGISRIQFWSYSQGQHALMGDEVDWYHIDEEPKDPKIFPQVVTRTITGNKGKGGRGILTFTPENGRTELVINFMDTPGPEQYLQRATWDDAEHLTESMKIAILDLYPPYQRAMRSRGEPLLGSGLIFDLPIDDNKVKPFECPNHWYIINGLDFGWDHPQAHIQLWENRDADIIYVAYAWKKRKTQPYEAWECTKAWAERVPTAWPADGLQTEKGSAKEQQSYYRKAGWEMLSKHATWPSGDCGVEQGIVEIYSRIKNKKLMFIGQMGELTEEFLQYHRDDNGKIVKIKDDLLSALRYAYMMRRHALRKYDIIDDDDEVEYETKREYW